MYAWVGAPGCRVMEVYIKCVHHPRLWWPSLDLSRPRRRPLLFSPPSLERLPQFARGPYSLLPIPPTMAANSPNPSTTNEKASVSNQDLPSTKNGFFSRKANKPHSNVSNEKSNDTAVNGAPAKQIPPASFSSLFRSVSYPASLQPFHLSSSLPSPGSRPSSSSSSTPLVS